MNEILYCSQSRGDFDPEKLARMGVSRVYATPFDTSHQEFIELRKVLENLAALKAKAESASKLGVEVYPFIHIINNPEGNYRIPDRYRKEVRLDGTENDAFVCIYDATRQEEILRQVQRAAELGFDRILFDDDLRDAFCCCREHLDGFEPFRGRPRDEITRIVNGILTHPEHEQLRRQWYAYKYERMCVFARQIEKTVHGINGRCRIGLCNSAKRCQDYSGRKALAWIREFSTEQAPTFVRLCGECYDDSVWTIVQSTGWHRYYDGVFPDDIEKMLEITSVPAIIYRSPGTVMFECRAVQTVTRAAPVLWAWSEEFMATGLDEEMAAQRSLVQEIADEVPWRSAAPFRAYIGEDLGAYTPTDVVTTYGAAHDSLVGHNMIALAGIPIVPTSELRPDDSAAICCAYISREMIGQIDAYVGGGGIAVLDAVAAKCYRRYGGQVAFEVNDPVELNLFEIGPAGYRDRFIADCPPESIHPLSCRDEDILWRSYDIEHRLLGTTIAGMRQASGGCLMVLGYDLSLIRDKVLSDAWRQRLLQALACVGFQVPVYWRGPALVQVVTYPEGRNKAALINYNTNAVRGSLVVPDKTLEEVRLEPRQIKIVSIRRDAQS